ncbi:hypothetical protein RHGRI_024158 [Rhododendron griersonianum]|uniref:Annexin n=1 Tax=Rhododendron griersonianum TaxID=479676 RepID=A0AAV6J9N7_9ERIC|nr:hypothetical protein RHGRI_024158 [Rhododendron griersonianum]KAG5536638.1 hypothetical protein RHGRI_024158 [Rhododendron griersonianum]
MSAPPEVASKSIESVPPEVTTLPPEGTVPPKVTTTSIESVPLDDAIHLNRAFAGWGCDEVTILNILAHRSAEQRTQIRQEYKTKFSEDFDHRLSNELMFSPDLKRALLLRMDDPTSRDAKIVKHGLSNNLNVAIEVICSRTPSKLEELKKAYRTMFTTYLDEDIESYAQGDNKKAVKRETSSEFKCALLTILQCAENPEKYFAKALHKAMDGLGTDDETLTRIIVSRAEVDIEKMKAEYLKKYGKPLSDVVHSETSGHYRAFLLSLLNPNP